MKNIETMKDLDSLIYNLDLVKQPIDYSGILKSPYAPTDIDGSIDWKGRGWIFFECKQKGKEMPVGQKIMYDRLLQSISIFAIIVVFEHEEYDASKPIIARDCKIKAVYRADRSEKSNDKIKGEVKSLRFPKGITVKDYTVEALKEINRLSEVEDDSGDFLDDESVELDVRKKYGVEKISFDVYKNEHVETDKEYDY